MHHILKAHHPLKHVKSFKYAFQGVFHTLAHEANFRVQVLTATVAIILGVYTKIDTTQWAILTLSLGLLLSAEMINTVIENVMDALFKEYHDVVKIVKDVSAGFVLITGITAFINLMLIFGEPLLELITL